MLQCWSPPPGVSGSYGDSSGGQGALTLVSEGWLTATGLCWGLSTSSVSLRGPSPRVGQSYYSGYQSWAPR